MVAVVDENSLAAVRVTGDSLTCDDLVAVGRNDAPVLLAAGVCERVEASFATLRRLVHSGATIYGLSTGVGALDHCQVDASDNSAAQRHLLRSHAAGVGEPMNGDEVRAMMLARTNNLARGVSGVQPEVLDFLVTLLNVGVVPRVPSMGLLGASDLAPLAHMGLLLIGEGQASHLGPFAPSREVLARAGLEPPTLAWRDAFALINGVAASAAVAGLAVIDAERLCGLAEIGAAMNIVATGGRDDSFAPRLAESKGLGGASASAARLRSLLLGRSPVPGPIREPLSTRSAHQVIGAGRDAISYARQVVERELNAEVDNPIVAADGFHTNSAANFHSQELADVMDWMTSAMISQAVMSERRVARLVDPHHNGGLPPFLVSSTSPGTQSGFMIAHYTAAALVADLRTRALPAAIQSIPVSGNTEDHAPMTGLAARRARSVVDTAELVIAIELLAGARALDLAGAPPTPGLRPCYEVIRALVPPAVEDRLIGDDIEAIAAAIRRGDLDPKHAEV